MATLKSLLGALALASLPAALAFRNTSPFLLFSTAELNIPSNPDTLATANVVEDQIKKALEGCPSKTYLIVRQDGVHSAEFAVGNAAPALKRYASGREADVKSTMVVPEVLGGQGASEGLSQYIQTKCGAKVLQSRPAKAKFEAGGPWVVDISFADPGTSQRLAELRKHDAQLESFVREIAPFNDYTVIYTSTPPNEEISHDSLDNERTYEMEDPFGGAVQMELKRDLSAHKRATNGQGGLFERYQFLSPPLFMGLLAILPLFAIVFVGLKALSSLEVSYFAFSKEMGPTAQRKQQ
ncbi:BIG1-domain-containing protein [Lentithecium fluviatile CBS 122367]|uniref:Protein BIG1 n=1 Tax=Lentithecium fluviatile CBS 122367 TaxID=1168545 RepID=A0A6G1IYQ7_9PLEO|nr:BIG1-domain-containing protein [Lentithecium fluviatile CBS 122367]